MIVSVCAAMVLGLSACGDASKNENTTTAAQTAAVQETATQAAQTPQTQDTASTDDIFTFNTKGTAISMKADAAQILEALGEWKSYTEETSCAFDGLDKNYTYSSFVMTTYPDGEIDRVNSLTLRDDTVSTSAGISIGDPQEKVEEAYGADAFNGVNAYILTSESGDAQLTVILTSGKVSSIQYAALFD